MCGYVTSMNGVLDTQGGAMCGQKCLLIGQQRQTGLVSPPDWLCADVWAWPAVTESGCFYTSE